MSVKPLALNQALRFYWAGRRSWEQEAHCFNCHQADTVAYIPSPQYAISQGLPLSSSDLSGNGTALLVTATIQLHIQSQFFTKYIGFLFSLGCSVVPAHDKGKYRLGPGCLGSHLSAHDLPWQLGSGKVLVLTTLEF